jgi:hypothetical protein
MRAFPPPLTGLKPGATWEQFEQRLTFEHLRCQPEPTARSPEAVLADRTEAAELKARIFEYGLYPEERIQASHAATLRFAWCKLGILLWRTFPFDHLPVEIVANIFRYAVWSTVSSPRGVLARFRMTWVCRRWRHIAVCDQTLWNTIWFKDIKIDYERSKLFFERAGTATLDLRIEDDDKTRVVPDQPMTGDDMKRILDMIMTKSCQIRMLIVVVESWPAILVLLDQLHRFSRSLQQLQRVEIHRTGRPYRWDGPGYPLSDYQHALSLCDGRTHRINYLCLNGIHLDWDKARFANLTDLDLRRMPPDLGPSLDLFRDMLTSSPNLKKLSLDGAGPVAPTGLAARSYPPVFLPRLESFILGDMLVSYAMFCARLIHAPNVREMTLLNFVGEDHARLLKVLTGKFPEVLILTLYSLNVQKSPKNGRIVVQWLLSMPKVKFMRVALMKAHMFTPFFIDGRLHINDDIPLTPTLEEIAVIRANGTPIVPFPALEAIEVQHIDINTVVNFVYGRKKDGVPLRRLYIHHNWLESMTPQEKEAIQSQNYEYDFVNVTVPMSMTPYEETIWKQVRGLGG